MAAWIAVAVWPSGIRAADLGKDPTGVNLRALRMAIEDLSRTFPDRYTRGGEFLRRLDAIEPRLKDALAAQAQADPKRRKAPPSADCIVDDPEALALKREALLANPLLGFDRSCRCSAKAITMSGWTRRLGIG
jgi:hypothetical protein